MSIRSFVGALEYAERPTVPAHEKYILMALASSSASDEQRNTIWLSKKSVMQVMDALSSEYPNISWDVIRVALEKWELAGGPKARLGSSPDDPNPNPFGPEKPKLTGVAECVADMPDRRQFVYLMKSGDRYKIGITGNLDRRLSQIGRQSPYPVEIIHSIRAVYFRDHETRLHDRFVKYRVHGEWFVFDDDQIPAVIEAMNDCINAAVT